VVDAFRAIRFDMARLKASKASLIAPGLTFMFWAQLGSYYQEITTLAAEGDENRRRLVLTVMSGLVAP
jgi:hypothetical protein